MRSNFRWAIYYEPETSGDPTPDEIAADLQYLRARYGGDRSYYRIDGRPVVFVHGGTLDDCATAERWRQANADIAAFLVLRVFTGFRQCAARPDGWHQYGRAAADSQPGYAYTISPGYWRANESLPRVERDLGRFRQNVRDMIASKAPFQLVTTFNHWGDGTAVENAGQWATPSGYGGYLDALHDNGEPPGSPGPLPDGDPVLVAAGDIACDPTSTQFRGGAGVSTACRQRYTADLVRPDVAGVLALGDNQYNDNQLVKYQQAYDLSWGRFKDLIRPGIGNHEYLTPGAAGYFDYFDGVGNAGGPAGDRSRGYYSYDVGSWHVVSLNSNCSLIGGCGSGSPQERWLREDLAAHPSACTLAYWHHPRFSSGEHGSIPWTGAFWADLHAAGAEAVLSGHDHDYERFAPQDRSGAADPTGPRQFVVGTGGRSHYPFVATQPNSEVRDATSFGVLELTLHATSYEWRFVPEVGGSFTDSGSAACR
jgi:hypothetical protein